jgi:hypothetical protein
MSKAVPETSEQGQRRDELELENTTPAAANVSTHQSDRQPEAK